MLQLSGNCSFLTAFNCSFLNLMAQEVSWLFDWPLGEIFWQTFIETAVEPCGPIDWCCFIMLKCWYLFSRDHTTSSNVIQQFDQLSSACPLFYTVHILRRVRVVLSNLHDSHLESIIFLEKKLKEPMSAVFLKFQIFGTPAYLPSCWFKSTATFTKVYKVTWKPWLPCYFVIKYCFTG